MESINTGYEQFALKKQKQKRFPFCVSANTWIAKDTSNLAWQILDTKTNILSLFAESLLWRIKGAGKYKQSIFCNCSSSGLCVMPPWRPCFDGLQYLHREVSILILRLGYIWCCMKGIKKQSFVRIFKAFLNYIWPRAVVSCRTISPLYV